LPQEPKSALLVALPKWRTKVSDSDERPTPGCAKCSRPMKFAAATPRLGNDPGSRTIRPPCAMLAKSRKAARGTEGLKKWQSDSRP
jgi:hypothetical protein